MHIRNCYVTVWTLYCASMGALVDVNVCEIFRTLYYITHVVWHLFCIVGS